MTSPMTLHGRRQDLDTEQWLRGRAPRGSQDRKWETWEPFKESPGGHNIYDIIADSKNNAYFTDIGKEHIGRIDAKTGKITLHETPTKGSGPRRGMMDEQDRFGSASIAATRSACSTPRPRNSRNGRCRRRGLTLTTWHVDKNGEVWTGSMINDRIVRLDPKTGQFVDYLLPRFDQHPPRIRRQHDDARHVLGRQQPRRLDHQAGAARLIFHMNGRANQRVRSRFLHDPPGT